MYHGFTLASHSLADELPSSQQQSVIEASLSEQVSKRLLMVIYFIWRFVCCSSHILLFSFYPLYPHTRFIFHDRLQTSLQSQPAQA